MAPMTAKLGILISGRGSNMQAIVGACQRGDVPAEVALVISNRAAAPGLEWARSTGLATAALSHREFPSREAHDAAISARLRDAGVEWVCLAGYMRLLSRVLLDAFPHRVVNIHPSLLPAFPGLDAQRQAWEHGVKVSGCTVHLVDEKLDHGPIVVQRCVPVHEADTPESLAERILHEEHLAYPEALRLLLGGAPSLDGRRLRWNAEPS